jgi:hypothetical protein
MTFEEAVQADVKLLWLDLDSRCLDEGLSPSESSSAKCTRRARAASTPARFQWKKETEAKLKRAGWEKVFFRASPWPPGPDGFCDVVIQRHRSPGFREGFTQLLAAGAQSPR